MDIWQLRRGIYWPQQHNDVIQKILRKSRKGTRVVYIPGNHDDLLAKFYGAYGNITVQKHAIHRLADGRRMLIIHGHEFDAVALVPPVKDRAVFTTNEQESMNDSLRHRASLNVRVHSCD